MQKLAFLAATALMMSFIAVRAEAMPAAPLNGASSANQVIHVAEGCGRGWHRGPHGHCRPN
jgi:hypothetical protein